MASSGGVLGIVGLGGGRLQQSWLLTEDACVAPMGSFPDCVLWDVNRYCKKKKKTAKRVVQCLRLAAGGPGCCPSLRMPSQACTPGPHSWAALGLGRRQRGSGCDPEPEAVLSPKETQHGGRGSEGEADVISCQSMCATSLKRYDCKVF